MSEFCDRVARGAALLDDRAPGWRSRIDLDRLNLENTCDCVIGQVFAADASTVYFDAVEELFGDDDLSAAIDHGFELPWHEEHAYQALTDVWRSVLADSPAVGS